MPVSLSIKDVPDTLAKALRERAAANHRSIQGELMHIIETSVRAKPFRAYALLERARALGISSPSESTEIVRKDRDR